MNWQPDWSVGEAALDREHQSLIAIINALGAALLVGPSELDRESFAHQVLSELVSYAENHFRHEEEVMAVAEFPDLERHREGHLHFRKQVMDLAARVAEDPQALAELHTFLTAWLRHHILEQDKRYSPFLQGPRAWSAPGSASPS